jgi:hypothetical protein
MPGYKITQKIEWGWAIRALFLVHQAVSRLGLAYELALRTNQRALPVINRPSLKHGNIDVSDALTLACLALCDSLEYGKSWK